MKKLTRDRVVPIISASVSWLSVIGIGGAPPSSPKFASTQQQARQPSFAGIEQLVDQVVFDPAVSGQQIGDEERGKPRLRIEGRKHRRSCYRGDHAVFHGLARRGASVPRLRDMPRRRTAPPPKIPTTASLPCSDSTVIFTLPFWMKNTVVGDVALAEYLLVLGVSLDRLSSPDPAQKSPGIERVLYLKWHRVGHGVGPSSGREHNTLSRRHGLRATPVIAMIILVMSAGDINRAPAANLN